MWHQKEDLRLVEYAISHLKWHKEPSDDAFSPEEREKKDCAVMKDIVICKSSGSTQSKKWTTK